LRSDSLLSVANRSSSAGTFECILLAGSFLFEIEIVLLVLGNSFAGFRLLLFWFGLLAFEIVLLDPEERVCPKCRIGFHPQTFQQHMCEFLKDSVTFQTHSLHGTCVRFRS
jgi:hypothetical protein